MDIVYNIWKPEKTLIEIEAENRGHRVLYLPQYHPEYNSIEYAWSFVKGYARRSPPKSMNDLLRRVLPEAFSLLDGDKAFNMCNHVIKKYRQDWLELQTSNEPNQLDEMAIEEGNLREYIDDEDENLFAEIVTSK